MARQVQGLEVMHVRLVGLAVALVGCHRFVELDEPSLRCSWDPAPTFDAVEPVSSVNTVGWEGDPTLSSDGLTLFYDNEAGLQMARRSSRGTAFGPPEEIPTTVPFDGATGLFVTADALGGLISIGSLETDYDIASIARPSPSEPFGAPSPISALHTPQYEFNARLSPDQQWLLFTRWLRPSDVTSARLMMARRNGTDWSDVRQVFPDATSTEESGSFVGDELHIVFSRAADLYTASRRSVSEPFDAPILLTGPGSGISTSTLEGIPFAASDGCELLFVAGRPNDAAGTDIYRATVRQED
jgi:hypothetical protein